MGKGSSPTIGFWYGITLHMGLCHGPIDAIYEIRGADKPMYPGYSTPPTYNDNGIMLTPPSGALQDPLTDNTAVAITAPNLYGGEKQEGGVVGSLTVLMGAPDQGLSDALAPIESGNRTAYRNICTCVFTGLVAAMSPYIKPWAYRCGRFLKGWNTAVWLPDLVKCDRGMNPAHIIYQCLTDPVWGGSGDPATEIDADSFGDAAQTLYNEGLGLCLKWSSADKIGDFIGVVLNHIAALRYIDPVTNRVGLRLLRNDYDVATLAEDPANILDENDIIEMTSYQPPALDESVNEVVVTYHDVATHKDASIAYQNLANIQAQGKVVSQSVDYPGAWNADIAARLCARDCHTKSALLVKGETKVKSTRWADLKVGDVKLLSWAREKCVLMPIRILAVNQGDATARSITISWAQDEFGLPASSYVVAAPVAWVEPNHAPQPITEQRLMEVPYRDLARTLDAANLGVLADDAGFLCALATRPANSACYNFRLTTRVGSADYADRGAGDFINGGALVDAIGPTATAITLTGFSDLSRVRIGSAALLDDEIVRVDAIDAGTGAVTLGRGCVDTVPASHDAGTRLWFYEDYAAADKTEYVDAETVDAKLLTVSSQGMLTLSEATAISLTMDQRQARPYPPGNLTINGDRYPASASGDLVLAWSHRDRLLSDDQLIDTLQGNIGPEVGTTYTVRVYIGGTLDSTITGITATTLTSTVSAGGTVRVEIDAVRDALVSWQPLTASFSYAASALAISGSAPDGVPAMDYGFAYTRTGGISPFSFSISAGSLPPGIALDTATGELSGAPTMVGTYSWTVQVEDDAGSTATVDDGVDIAYATLMLSGTYAGATVGEDYSSDLIITGGDGTYSLTGGTGVTSGSLPSGTDLSIVTVDSNTYLRLSGTSSGEAGTDSFTVSVESGDGQTATSAQSVIVGASTAHRYWRLLITANNGYSGVQVAELELRGVSGGPDLTSSSTPIPATASGEFGGYPATQAFDNDASTVWFFNSPPTQWLAYDFGTPKTITEISLNCVPVGSDATIGAKDFSIQRSDDGSTWTTEWSVTGQTGWSGGETRVFAKP